MLMTKAEGSGWNGNSIYISFNKNSDLGIADYSEEWSRPELLIHKPNHVIWHPSLQPGDNKYEIQSKFTCLKVGNESRLFYKDNHDGIGEYLSEYRIKFYERD